MKKDPFFERIDDGEWNACVGVQGDELNYVDGFLDAAVIVADALIDGELTGSRDTLAMPILYNVRHGLELALKFVIGNLTRIGMVADRPGEPDHDIHAYWTHLSGQTLADYRLRKLIAELEPFVASLNSIDKDGGELRYFENREGRRSLGNHPAIHLKLVRANVHKLRKLLHDVTDRVEYLEIERPTGTHTDILSRTDLKKIAETLGPRPTWKEESFDERRSAAKAEFEIGNRPLTAAIEAIEKSRQLGVLLGKLTPPIQIKTDRIIRLAGMWLQAHPPRAGSGKMHILTRKDVWMLLKRGMPEQTKLDTDVAKEFSLEELADVETIFYVGTVPLMGEEYERKLGQTLAEHRAIGDAERYRWEKVHHIMAKTNFLKGLMEGLRRIGSPDIADAVHAIIQAAQSNTPRSSSAC